jgi:hypothetical protein
MIRERVPLRDALERTVSQIDHVLSFEERKVRRQSLGKCTKETCAYRTGRVLLRRP